MELRPRLAGVLFYHMGIKDDLTVSSVLHREGQ
jgi:hypothetical protein